MSAKQKQATIEKVGFQFKVNENGILRRFQSLDDAIEFCNKHQVQVTNKEKLTPFFQSKLIY